MTDSSAAEIEQRLIGIVPAKPESLYDPVRFLLEAGGKRARPLLTLLCSRIAGKSSAAESNTREDATNAARGRSHDNAIKAGVAVELLHNFTLVHDDMMDHAASRRGRPTLHTTYGDSSAILSGDVLVALACEALSTVESSLQSSMIREFALGFRSVCEGQALDTAFELRPSISVAEYMYMIDMKTAKIFELAAVLGSLSAGGAHVEALRAYAHHLGLAFQIADDVLDLTAENPAFGKTVGGDILEGKRTFLFAAACERQNQLDNAGQQLVERIRSRSASAEDIPLAQNVMEQSGILQSAREQCAEETRLAETAIETITSTDELEALREFGRAMLRRDR